MDGPRDGRCRWELQNVCQSWLPVHVICFIMKLAYPGNVVRIFYRAWVSGRLAGMGAALGSDTSAMTRSLSEQKELWVKWDEEW